MATTLEIVLPIFGLILLGYAVAKRGLIDRAGVQGITAFVFYVAIPAMLFRAMSQGLPPGGLEWGILGAYYGASAAVGLLGYLAARHAFAIAPDGAVVIGMGAGFSNGVMIGLPLMQAAFGGGGLLALMLVIAFHSSILIGGPTLLIEAARGRGGGTLRVLRATVLSLGRNPVIGGLLLGILWGVADWPVPTVLDRLIELLGRAAPAAALFALGASLAGYRVASGLRQSLSVVALKLLLHPLLVWLLAAFVFKLPALWTAVATITAALPVGANVFVLAQRYDVQVGPSTSAVLISTGLSVATVTLLVHLFHGAT